MSLVNVITIEQQYVMEAEALPVNVIFRRKRNIQKQNVHV